MRSRSGRSSSIVDDSTVIRKIARRIPEELDFQIIEAEDGEKALQACRRGLPDAILLDWNMPIKDGYEFLGNLRRMLGDDARNVVFRTTENGMDHIARAGRRRQRIHHEAVRQGHRRREVPGSRSYPGCGAGVAGAPFLSSYQVASGLVMSTGATAGQSPRHGCSRRGGFPRHRVSRPQSAHTAPHIGIRVTVKSPGDVYPKSLQFVSRGRP